MTHRTYREWSASLSSGDLGLAYLSGSGERNIHAAVIITETNVSVLRIVAVALNTTIQDRDRGLTTLTRVDCRHGRKHCVGDLVLLL